MLSMRPRWSDRPTHRVRDRMRRLYALVKYCQKRNWLEGERRASRALVLAWREYLDLQPDPLAGSATRWPSRARTHDLLHREPHAHIPRRVNCDCRHCQGTLEDLVDRLLAAWTTA